MSQNTVTVAEALSIRVGNHIIAQGTLALANQSGRALDSLTWEDSLGLLEGSKFLKRKFAVLFSFRQRRPFIGVLCFQNAKQGITNKKWLLETHGRIYLPLMQELAEELSAKFEVEIHVRLVSEDPGRERFMSDYGD